MPLIHCSYDKLVPIAELKEKFNPKNRNKHPPEQLERLAKILEYQGARKAAVLSNLSGHLTAGHGRILAAEIAGFTEYPVDFQDYDSEEQEYADLTADNAVSLWSELDFSGINTDIGSLGPDFDLDLLGIKNFKIDVAEKEALTDPDSVPAVPAEPRTKLGDVYCLGVHRLMCGDSTIIDSVEKLMDGQKADMVFTDPPYGISLGFNETPAQAKARNRRVDGLKVSNDDLQGDSLEEFLTTCLSNASTALKPGGAFYICSPIGKEVRKFIAAIESCDWHYQCGLVWNKSSLSLSRFDYHPKHEIVHYGWKAGAAHSWLSDRKQTSVFDFDKPSKSELHPTTKPVELIEYFVGNNVPQGALILDLFGGSGSTLIAAEKTGRAAHLMELDPKYCDVIVKRWEDYTGRKAELLNG